MKNGENEKRSSFLQPQQPDDQYPGVPVQGWTPPPANSLRYAQDQIAKKLAQIEKLFKNKVHIACVVYEPGNPDTAIATFSKEASSESVIEVIRHLERKATP